MTDPQDLGRREILRRGILLGVVCIVPDAASAMSALVRTDRWKEFGARVFPHAESARVIGGRYLASHDASYLVSAVVKRLDRQSVDLRGGTDKDLMMAALQSDYESSRLVDVDGWVLSETEVAFCVIAALGHGE